MIRNEPGALSLSSHILEVSLLRIPEALPLTTLWLCSCHLVFFFFLDSRSLESDASQLPEAITALLLLSPTSEP